MKVIVIGGFALDETPLLPILTKFNEAIFININDSDLAEVKYQVINKLNHDDETLLIGYSTGGLILLSIYEQIKHKRIELVLLNSTPYFMANDLWNGIKSDDYNNLVAKLEQLDRVSFIKYFAALAAYPCKRHNQTVNVCSSNDKKLLYEWLIFIKNTDLRNILYSIMEPVLMISSQDDILVKPNRLPENNNITMRVLSNSSHSVLNFGELFELLSEYANVK